MTKVSWLFALSIILTLGSSAANAQSFQGKVTKEGTRLARPSGDTQGLQLQLQTAQTAPTAAAGKISDEGFLLNTNRYNVNAQANPSWNPYAEIRPRLQWQAAPPSRFDGDASVEPDYDAVERAYAEIGRHFVPQIARSNLSSQLGASPIVSSPWAIQAAAAGRLTANGTLAVTPQEAATIDGDHCQCQAPMPTTTCIQSRMQGFGTNINTTPRVMMPGSAPFVTAPRMSSGRPVFTFTGR